MSSRTKLDTRLTFKKSSTRLWYGLLAIGFVGVGSFLLFARQTPVFDHCPLKLQTSQECIVLETATNDKQRVQGLSGRKSMPDTRGMLFVFDTPSKPCFWMKDMHFSLDIIWLDGHKKIMQIDKKAAPDTYPKNFCPHRPAQYVIEVNEGIADKAGLAVGQQLKL